LRMQQRLYGANLGPFEAWLVLRGLRTLALRMREQCANAMKVAQWLIDQPAIAKVIYPGLPDHLNHEVAQRLFRARNFGGVVSFELRDAAESQVPPKDGDYFIFRFMEALKLIRTGTSLGDVYSLLLYPAQSSHHALGVDERHRRGITDGLVRLSVGIEDAADIIADLKQALNVMNDK
jgi:cystathionine gamma-synthase